MKPTQQEVTTLIRACLHGRRGPQIGEVTCGGSPHLSCKRDEIEMRDYMDKRVTHQSGLPYLPGVPHLQVNEPKARHTVRLLNQMLRQCRSKVKLIQLGLAHEKYESTASETRP